MSDSLPNYVVEQLRQRRSEQDVRNELIDRGYPPDYVESLMAETKQVYPLIIPHQKQERAKEKRALRREEKRNWPAPIITGIALFLLGIVVTFGSYALAGPSGGRTSLPVERSLSASSWF